MSEHATPNPSTLRDRNDDVTELVFVLDRSGSMSGLEQDTIGGFNSMVAKQKNQGGRALVTTVLFDHEMEMLHERQPIETVRELTDEQYYARGCTALLDAVGSTVKRINKAQKARGEGRPEHTVFVIATDGEENASTRFSVSEVKELIEKREKKNGWDFIFLGANIDAVEAAGSIGIAADRAVDYEASAQGTAAMYGAIDDALCSIRACGALSQNWKACIANADEGSQAESEAR